MEPSGAPSVTVPAPPGYAAFGKRFAFGVINTDPQCTPDCVFKPGSNSQTGAVYPVGAASKMISDGYMVPVTWDEPVYVARMKDFIKALGARYNGNTNIAFLEVRNYGGDGEGNGSFNPATKDISAESLKTHFFKPYTVCQLVQYRLPAKARIGMLRSTIAMPKSAWFLAYWRPTGT